MTRPTIKILLVCNFLTLLLSAQEINNIEFTGISSFSNGRYLEWMSISEGSGYFEGIQDTIKDRISRGLLDEGYFHFGFNSVDFKFSPDSQSVEILIELNEGEPTVRNIRWRLMDTYQPFEKKYPRSD